MTGKENSAYKRRRKKNKCIRFGDNEIHEPNVLVHGNDGSKNCCLKTSKILTLTPFRSYLSKFIFTCITSQTLHTFLTLTFPRILIAREAERPTCSTIVITTTWFTGYTTFSPKVTSLQRESQIRQSLKSHLLWIVIIDPQHHWIGYKFIISRMSGQLPLQYQKCSCKEIKQSNFSSKK